jgi:two-component system cell cycle response regulator
MGLMAWFDFGFFLILLALFIYVFVYNQITLLHKVYLLFHFFMMIWPLGQFAVHTTNDARFQLFYINVSFVGLSLLGFGWLLFTKYLTDETYRPKQKSLVLSLLPSLFLAVAVVWNPGGLFMAGIGGQYQIRTYGPLFWLMVAVLVGYLAVSFHLLWSAFRSENYAHARPQVANAITGVFVLVGFAMFDLLLNVVLDPWLPVIPGLTSLGIVLSDLYFVFSLKKHRIFDIVRFAHQDVIDTMPAGVIVLDESDKVIEMNRIVDPRLGIGLGSRFEMEEFLASVDGSVAAKPFLAAYRMNPPERAQTEIAVTHGDEVIHMALHAAPIIIKQKMAGRVITIQDITELRLLIDESHKQYAELQERNRALMLMQDELYRANMKLEQMAITDGLTGCYNRRYLMHQLEREVVTNVRYRIPFAVFLFDIDLFKAVNDTFGHLVGDEVIRRTAEVVRASLRRTDILARYGGEEFTVYLPHTNRIQAEMLAQRIRKAVETNLIPAGDGSHITVTISMGVLTVEEQTEAGIDNPKSYLRELFAKADAALYRAKESGRNRIVNF